MLLVPFAVILAVCMLAVSYIDFRRMVIPNWLNVTVLIAGIAFKALLGPQALIAAIMFGTLVFLAFWTLRYLHWRLRGVIGLGFGDVKFAGAAAVWLDPWSFPAFLFTASALALLYFGVIARRAPDIASFRVPFGPFLAFALFVTWNFNTFYSQAYG